MSGSDGSAERAQREQAAADARTALAALAQQLADRTGPARPMRSSMQAAYRVLMEREADRMARLDGRRTEH